MLSTGAVAGAPPARCERLGRMAHATQRNTGKKHVPFLLGSRVYLQSSQHASSLVKSGIPRPLPCKSASKRLKSQHVSSFLDAQTLPRQNTAAEHTKHHLKRDTITQRKAIGALAGKRPGSARRLGPHVRGTQAQCFSSMALQSCAT